MSIFIKVCSFMQSILGRGSFCMNYCITMTHNEDMDCSECVRVVTDILRILNLHNPHVLVVKIYRVSWLEKAVWCGSLGAVSSALKVAHSVRLTAQLMAFTVVHGFYWAIWKLKAWVIVLCSQYSFFGDIWCYIGFLKRTMIISLSSSAALSAAFQVGMRWWDSSEEIWFQIWVFLE